MTGSGRRTACAAPAVNGRFARPAVAPGGRDGAATPGPGSA
jgi:hypothetical protein